MNMGDMAAFGEQKVLVVERFGHRRDFNIYPPAGLNTINPNITSVARNAGYPSHSQ